MVKILSLQTRKILNETDGPGYVIPGPFRGSVTMQQHLFGGTEVWGYLPQHSGVYSGGARAWDQAYYANREGEHSALDSPE